MNEFRKPYEYMEEKGVSGFLLIYFLMLLGVETILGVITLFYGYDLIAENRILGTVIVVISAFHILFSLFSSIVLKSLKKYAVRVSKVFLVSRLFYLIPYIVFTMISQIREIPNNIDTETYSKMLSSIITSSVISILFVMAFSVGWYIYLNRSRKVRELFPAGSGSSGAQVGETAGAHDRSCI